MSATSVPPRKSQKLNYAFRKADWDHLRALFSHTPWEIAYFDNSLDFNWQAWTDLFFAAVDQCVPKQKPNKKVNAPWITKDLVILCRKKKSLYRIAKQSGRDHIWTKYRNLNNYVKKSV